MINIQLIFKKYDIVIHIRLGDFFGRIDFIEYEYYEKLFEHYYQFFINVFVWSESGGRADRSFLSSSSG